MNLLMIGGADGPTAIFLAGKFNVFMIPAFGIMILFYGIYFIKQMAQKRQGITTRQLGRRKDKSIHTIEVVMSLATVLIVFAQVFSILFELSLMPMPVRIAGIILGTAGDLVFLTAVLTMKNSWRAGIPDTDKTEFVFRGIPAKSPCILLFLALT